MIWPQMEPKLGIQDGVGTTSLRGVAKMSLPTMSTIKGGLPSVLLTEV